MATLGVQLLNGGTHSITAQFLGDSNYGQSSVSGILTVVVNQTPSSGAGSYTHVPTGSGAGGFTFGQPVYGSSLFGGVNDKVTFGRACLTCAYPSGNVTATITRPAER